MSKTPISSPERAPPAGLFSQTVKIDGSSDKSPKTRSLARWSMIKTIFISMCLAACALSLNARAAGERGYGYGPVTEVDYVHVEYGH
jgi:hypothetical protein